MEKLLGYLQATAARSRVGEERERLLLLVVDGGVDGAGGGESRWWELRSRRWRLLLFELGGREQLVWHAGDPAK